MYLNFMDVDFILINIDNHLNNIENLLSCTCIKLYVISAL